MIILDGGDNMKVINGVIHLSDNVRSIFPNADCVTYVDETGTKYVVPSALIIRLYDLYKFEMGRKGLVNQEFDEHCYNVIKDSYNKYK